MTRGQYTVRDTTCDAHLVVLPVRPYVLTTRGGEVPHRKYNCDYTYHERPQQVGLTDTRHRDVYTGDGSTSNIRSSLLFMICNLTQL